MTATVRLKDIVDALEMQFDDSSTPARLQLTPIPVPLFFDNSENGYGMLDERTDQRRNDILEQQL